jgi:hypothetical protein
MRFQRSLTIVGSSYMSYPFWIRREMPGSMLSKFSMREFLHGMSGALGRAAGFAIEIILKIFFPH